MKVPNLTMFDVASAQSGAFVTVATSNDENYPASTIIDGDENTFWMTTGLYPQSAVVTFPQTVEIKSLQLISFGIKYLVIEKSSQSQPLEFEPIVERTLTNEERRVQKTDMPLNKSITARHLKLTILSGYDSFSSIHHLRVDGKAPR